MCGHPPTSAPGCPLEVSRTYQRIPYVFAMLPGRSVSGPSCGTLHTRTPGCLRDTACRTADRSASRALPSLWHATPPATSEPFREWVDSSSISRSRVTSDVVLELRALGSTGVTRLHRYYVPLRHPTRPGRSLTGVRLTVTRRHRWGFPCCVVIPSAHAVVTTPAEPLGPSLVLPSDSGLPS